MAEKIKGIDVQFGADTVTFDNSVKGINRALGVVNQNLKNTRKELRFDSKDIDTLKSKFENLGKSIDLNKKRLAMYQKELQQLDDSEIGSAKWASLKKQINNAESEIKTLTNEAKQTEEAIKDISKEEIKLKVDKAEKELQKIQEKALKTAESVDKIGKGFQTAGKVVSVAGVAIGAGFVAGVAGASDLEEAINAAKNQFGGFTDTLLSFTKDSATKFGESQATVLEYASSFKRIGMSNEEIQDVLLRTADIASEQNKTFEEVGDSVISIYNGSTEAGEKYGIQTKVNQLGQYLFEQGLVSSAKAGEKLVGTMSTAEKQALIYEKVMHDTNATQGDFANNTGTLAIEQKKAEATLQELVTTLSERLMPILTPLITHVTDFMNSILSLSDSQQDLIVIVGLIIVALGPLLIIVGKAISGFAALSTMAATAGVTLAAFVAPVVAAIGIVVALVAAVIYAYKNSEQFRNGVNKLGESVKQLVSGAFKTIVAFYNAYLKPMFEGLSKLAGKVVVDAMNFLINIINDILMPVIKQMFVFFKDSILPILGTLATFITETVVPALSAIWHIVAKYVLPVLVSIGAWVANNLIPIFGSIAKVLSGVVNVAFNTIFSVITGVVGVIKTLFGWVGDLWSSFKDSSAIRVISGAFSGLKGMLDGVLGSIKNVFNWFGDLANKASNTIGKIGSFLNPFDSGGYSFNSGGYGDVVLNATFNVTQSEGNTGLNNMRQASRSLLNMIDEGLGRRVVHG